MSEKIPKYKTDGKDQNETSLFHSLVMVLTLWDVTDVSTPSGQKYSGLVHLLMEISWSKGCVCAVPIIAR